MKFILYYNIRILCIVTDSKMVTYSLDSLPTAVLITRTRCNHFNEEICWAVRGRASIPQPATTVGKHVKNRTLLSYF